MFDKTDQLGVNSLRMLSIEAINNANSGHPGLPMGAAPMAYTLWTRHLNVNPKNSKWVNRDRFVLSAGHGSSLLYSLLHLAGYDVTIEDLKNFRQINSRTPGHPEVGETDGVEATTGPLGQGFANAVGMAMAEAHLSATYNKEGYNLVDHYTYTLCGDGDLMEGVSAEAASLAGHLKLGKLIALYDSNDISLDGPTSMTFTEDVAGRFEAYGWQYILVKDGNDLHAISKAIKLAQMEKNKPTLIEVKTVIGYGAPNQGTNKVHGAPLGEANTAITKDAYNWDYPPFTVPLEVTDRFKEAVMERGEKIEAEWKASFAKYRVAFPELAQQFEDAFNGDLPENWDNILPKYTIEDAPAATRKTSEATIQAIGARLPHFWGGSADLSSSNNTILKSEKDFTLESYDGRNIWFGVREFAMGTILNGIILHGGTLPYIGTFFVFSDYLRAAIRVAAISRLPGIYVFTHDSIGVGEDGPTHEPIEQLDSYRAMPNVNVIRPADGNEVSQAWKLAIESKETPSLLVLSRQNLPILEGTLEKAPDGVGKGAYVLSPSKAEVPDGILMASGSEVKLAIDVQARLAVDGIHVSVLSVPSLDLFELQDAEYKESVLPSSVRNRVSIEMGSSLGWGKYTGLDGINIGIDTFGASGKGELVIEQYGFTVNHVVKKYKEAFISNFVEVN
ncbi:transketolase [Mesobacillus maritimus]|uniref:Transketolase n=1 Tax=Mesobacillus maritimus TaxID=1643336 RepID=A0ABS7KB57_9BACI|nr:transketolase [Mesobacillus maritimus]MBY0099502.1 transketolase [Mesobacillus maritimus]